MSYCLHGCNERTCVCCRIEKSTTQIISKLEELKQELKPKTQSSTSRHFPPPRPKGANVFGWWKRLWDWIVEPICNDCGRK